MDTPKTQATWDTRHRRKKNKKNMNFAIRWNITLLVYIVQMYIQIWNDLYHFLLQTLISSLSIATFSVDRDKPQNRLQLSFTLVLTGVAFKFVANQSIPKISYLTQLVSLFLSANRILFLFSIRVIIQWLECSSPLYLQASWCVQFYQSCIG
jgi:hypothetical protein